MFISIQLNLCLLAVVSYIVDHSEISMDIFLSIGVPSDRLLLNALLEYLGGWSIRVLCLKVN